MNRTRSYLALAILTLLMTSGIYSLVASLQPLNPLNPPGLYENSIGEQILRAACLSDALPQDVTTFGYLPALPRKMEDPSITSSMLRLQSDSYRRYFLTQYALAPHEISYYETGTWIIANYPDYLSGIAGVHQNQTRYTVVKDCGNGVFLLKK